MKSLETDFNDLLNGVIVLRSGIADKGSAEAELQSTPYAGQDPSTLAIQGTFGR